MNLNEPTLKVYTPSMQPELERFFEACFTALGWGYEPQGRHADIPATAEVYMKNGCMWCLFDDDRIIGTSAIRTIEPGVAELKRLYILPEYQGNGYGRLLFETALQYAHDQGYERIRLDTRNDRSASRHLIESHGFTQIPQYNNNAYAELFYELYLTKPVIRPARETDAKGIWKINADSLGCAYDLEKTKIQLSTALGRPYYQFYVAEWQGKVVGYIHGGDYLCTYVDPLKDILALAVLPGCQGLGIGRLLLNRLEEWAKEEGCAGVRLVSGYNRTDAHRFYLHCGYTDRKDQKNFIKLFHQKETNNQ